MFFPSLFCLLMVTVCRWGMVIVDESSRMRTSKDGQHKTSKETIACHTVITNSARALLLSGTPTESRPYELWHQIDALTCKWPRNSRPLGSFKAFRKNYNPDEELSEDAELEMRNRPHWMRRRQDPLPKRLFELHMLLRTVCMLRRTKADVLTELPPKIRRIIELRGDEVQHGGSDRVNNSSQSGSSDAGAPAADVPELVESISAQQRCGLQKVARSDFQEMLQTVVSGVVAEKGQLLVFAHHHAVMDRLYAQLGKIGVDRGKPEAERFRVTRIDGATPNDERERGCADFQNPSSDTRVALISMTAGGQGLNLQAATTIIFAELPPKATTLHQCEARAHRQGQHSSVLVYIVIADEPSDRSMWKQLERSDVRVGRILDGHGHTARPTMAVDGVALAAAVAAPHGQSRSAVAALGSVDDTDDLPSATDQESGCLEAAAEIKLELDADDGDGVDELDDYKRHSVDSGGRPSIGGAAGGTQAAADVCMEEVLPVGGALFFLGASSPVHNSVLRLLCYAHQPAADMMVAAISWPVVLLIVSAHTGWVHLVQPDGTRLVRLDGTPLCFSWDALKKDADPPRWLARGTALRLRVEETYAEWQELGPIQQGRLVGRAMAPPLKEFMAPLPGAGAAAASSTIRVSDRREMLTSRQPDGSELKQQRYETHLGSTEVWPQYVSAETGRPHCSWLGCRGEYDRDGLLKQGLLPISGNRQFFCSDQCRKSYTLRADGSALRREAWDRDRGERCSPHSFGRCGCCLPTAQDRPALTQSRLHACESGAVANRCVCQVQAGHGRACGAYRAP